MSALLEQDACDAEVTAQLTFNSFFKTLGAARQSALFLDFDGTLAPFRIDPAAVRPWAGVATLLGSIQQQRSSRVAIVSGRPAQQVRALLGLEIAPEIWGLHGAERLMPDGKLHLEKLLPSQYEKLAAAKRAIRDAGLGLRNELKWNAVVVHWRGKSLRSAAAIRRQALTVLSPFAELPDLKLLHFDGGVELRAGRNKGDAVKLLLQSMADNAASAYLGDDTTDEDAFEVIAGRGLGVLVRRQWRPSAAQAWLRPPQQLRQFLTLWLTTISHAKRS